MSFLSWLDKVLRSRMAPAVDATNALHIKRVENQEKTNDDSSNELRRLRAELKSYRLPKKNLGPRTQK